MNQHVASEFLNAAELVQLTDYKQADKQEAWLKAHSFPYLRDGRRLIVSRHHVRECLAGRRPLHSAEFNWAAINSRGAPTVVQSREPNLAALRSLRKAPPRKKQ